MLFYVELNANFKWFSIITGLTLVDTPKVIFSLEMAGLKPVTYRYKTCQRYCQVSHW